MADAFGQHRKGRRNGAVLGRLDRVEVPQVCDRQSGFPIVISAARGARIKDADGNRYIDMTSFFGACLVGHRNPEVTVRARQALGHLIHAMGDVHPDQSRARLLEMVCGLMPGDDWKGLLSLNGSDAVECALKFAAATTGRGGIISFEGAYHGLSAGALEATFRPDFRRPFAAALSGRTVFAPWPAADGTDLDRVLSTVDRIAGSSVTNAWGNDIGRPGALIVEPIQGRGGMRVPPDGFLAGLAGICRRHGLVFITDEIYCGTFRTGSFLAADREDVIPDVVCLGKALGGGFPLSATMMRPAVADSVKAAGGEAVHTSTFLGWPMSCCAGIGALTALSRMNPGDRADQIEQAVTAASERWTEKFPFIVGVRGRGAMLGIETRAHGNMTRGEVSMAIVRGALRLGVVTLPEGPDADVVALTPPLVIGDTDLDTALRLLEESMEKVGT